jgi:hypothetical protein
LSQSSYNYDRYIRDYSQFNEADFLEEVGTFDWMDVFGDTDDVNLIFSSFFYTLSVLVDKHVPLKKLSKPWITKGIRVSIKRKNKFYKLYLKSKNAYYFSKYKSYRNKLKHLILLSKKSHHSNYF